MIQHYRVNRFVLLLLTVICSLQAFAGVEPYQNQLKGAIKKNDELTTKDEKFRNANFNWSEITNHTVKNFVSFEITHDNPVVLSQAFTCEVDLKVEYYSTPDQAEPFGKSVKLKVNFSPDAGATYKAKDIYEFSNGYLVKITVNNITSPELGENIPEVFQLTNQIVIDRQYLFHLNAPINFNCNFTSNGSPTAPGSTGTTTTPTANNFLQIDWDHVSGAEEYDVEWAVFDQGADKQIILDRALTNQTLTKDELNELFRNNATRVTTAGHQYYVTNVYNAQYIMVRIRQVHYTDGYREEDEWVYNVGGVYRILQFPDWHEQSLNWQYAATFAEEGKKKEVVSYFDGSLRGRQTVIINNSDKVAVVQETVYDGFGRAAGNILPAPTLDDKFHFYPKFNRNIAGNAYDYHNLTDHVNSVTCEPYPDKLSEVSGAANYYSPQNSFLSLNTNDSRYRNFNKYIPKAEGYPISVTQFTNDNTGRIRVQGGVGPAFQPGATARHATKYYYGKPETWELDRLFGNDVGYANRYQKNMVIEANGQISITYTNASGKTIATALTGKTPDGMDALPSQPTAKPETFTILRPQQFVFDATTLCLKAKTTYLNSVENAEATFNYNIQELIYDFQSQVNQSPFQICSNCYYNLTIRVNNDCGDPVYPKPGDDPGPIEIGSLTGDCNLAGMRNGQFNCTFREPGEYYISFEFKLSREAIETYTDRYIQTRLDNKSLKGELKFIEDYLTSTDFSGCFNECNTCEAALGTEEEFKAAIIKMLVDNGYDEDNFSPELYSLISNKYNTLRSGCLAMKATCMTSSCSKYEKEMLADVSPNGQYALFSYDPFTPLEQEVNVIAIRWRNEVFSPTIKPGMAAYEAETFIDENGNNVNPYDESFTLEMLVKYWKEEWAIKFLPFHPEKCKLEFCNQNGNYYLWDDQVQQLIKKVSDIPAIPGNNNGTTWSYTNGDWLVAIDPFFQTGPGAPYINQFKQDLQQFSTLVMQVNIADAQTKSLTQVIDYLLYCANIDGSTNSGIAGDSWNNCTPVASCRIPNREWEMYKEMYFQLKQKYYQLIRNNTTCATKCIVGTPYTLPGACPSIRNFSIERVIGYKDCPAGSYPVRVTYNGTVARQMAVYLYYPSEFSNVSQKPQQVNLYPGLSEGIVCVSDAIPFNTIRLKSVTCYNDPAAPACNGTSGNITLTGTVRQLASNIFREMANNGIQTTYTILPGRSDQPPVDTTYCTDGTVSVKQFYNCFKLHVPNSAVPFQFNNVWVIGCSKDLCANAPVYQVDTQLDQYRFYKGGLIYYVKLPNGGATPTCAYTPNYQPCIKVQVGGNAPIIFNNASIHTCEACPAGSGPEIPIAYQSGSDPITYVGTDDYTYYVYPNTWNGYTPPSMPCSVQPQFYTCIRFKGTKFGGGSYYNATVIQCPPAGGCAVRWDATYRTSANTYVWEDGGRTEYWTIFPNSGDGPPPAEPPCNGDYFWWGHMDCADVYVDDELQESYSNFWIAYCVDFGVGSNNKPGSSVAMKSGNDTGQIQLRNYSTHKYSPKNFTQTGKSAAADFKQVAYAVPCSDIYLYKKSRFPEFDYSASLSSQNLLNLQNENNALITGQVQTSCEAQADKWISQLSECIAAYPEPERAAKTAQIRAKLIEVCVNGGDIDHPYGSSTIRPDASGTPSFKQAMIDVFGSNALTMTCNPWLLDEPHPYEPKQQSVSKMLTVTNADLCAKLQQLRSGFTGGNFYDYLKATYGEAMNLTRTQFAMLEKSCDNCRFILEEDIPLPVFMEPGTQGCITAADYADAKNDLATEMGNNLNTSHDNYPDMLANFLNHRFGFSMAAYRYDDYEKDLVVHPTAILCNNLPYTEVEVEKYVCLKPLVQMAITNGHRDYVIYIEEEKRKFRVAYIAKCSQAEASSQITTKQQTYHYTLYYYDQAGNLIRTVSPEGVRFLSDDEMKLVDGYRKRDEDMIDCASMAADATENKAYIFNTFSSELQSGHTKSLEMWINGNTDSRNVRFVTPDNKYMYQAAIKNGKLWVELYTLAPGANGAIDITLTNHATAELSGAGIAEWSHLVVQANNIVSDPWNVYLNNKQLTLLSDELAPAYPFTWEIEAGYTLPAEEIGQLKHLRLYNQLIGASDIAVNYVNPCHAPDGVLNSKPAPMVIWGRFIPALCNNTVETRLVNNRGALQVNGNLGLSARWFPAITNNFTVEFWVNPQGQHQIDGETRSLNNANGSTGQQYVIYPEWGGVASANRAGMGISIGTNGVSVYEHADFYMPSLLVWQAPPQWGGWHHVAVVYNNRQPSLYIDGVWVRNGLQSQKANISPSYNLCSGPYPVMQGQVDELRIWNTARTAAEIGNNFNRSISPASNGLVAYWPISNADGPVLYDVTCANTSPGLVSNYNYIAGTANVQDLVMKDDVLPGVYPRHRLTTSFAFNSSNSVSRQKSPDGGISYFWYDMLGRLVASQNEEQRTPSKGVLSGKFSYTNFDSKGRIQEVGEKEYGNAPLPEPGTVTQEKMSLFDPGTKSQITKTIYDNLPAGEPGIQSGLPQDNLRGRVSASLYKETEAGSVMHASYYSYDLVGNAKTMWQQVDGLALKKFEYKYDLHSGKVNLLSYQHGEKDQFYYAYKYDAQNRLIEAYTGTQAIINERGATLINGQLDAFYQYYLHGILARTELGRNKVQGQDYAYTLQGWLKAINGNKLNAGTEMGGDGITANIPIARDVLALSLGYYKNDYEAIGTGVNAFSMGYLPQKNDVAGNELFNGNISNSSVAISKFRNGDPVGYTYRYDQLNRLKTMYYHPLSSTSTSWDINSKDPLNAYGENITYDGNGNIETYLRNGANTSNMPLAMDDLIYNYTPKQVDPVNNQSYRTTNQLQWVKETNPNVDVNYSQAGNGIEDIDNQSRTDNYQYDKVGNLIYDDEANKAALTWTVYGKIKNITQNANGNQTTYSYDAAGNRVKKTVTVGGQTTNTWYVRDAQGNTMAVYSDKQDNQQGMWWKEQQLYGCSRLGIWKPAININAADGTGEWGISGKKAYELTNQLGNVVATVADNSNGIDENGDNIVDYYSANVISANDYYPFGMQMPGRTFNGGNYRYGFNGKENDNEIKGNGNQLDYGMRVYDPRIGKFLSVDPLTKSFPMLTPYQYASNSPVTNIDLDGKEGTRHKLLYLGEPVVEIVNVKIYVNVTNNAAYAEGIFAGKGYENENKLVDELHGYLNEVYNDGKDIFKIMKKPLTVNEAKTPVYYQFDVVPIRADNNADFLANIDKIVTEKNENGNEVHFFEDSKTVEGTTQGNDYLFVRFHPLDPGTLASFDQQGIDNFLTLDKARYDIRKTIKRDFKNDIAHEVGHMFLSRHPDKDTRSPGKDEKKHGKIGGILSYTRPTKRVTQQNTNLILQSVIKLEDRNVNVIFSKEINPQ